MAFNAKRALTLLLLLSSYVFADKLVGFLDNGCGPNWYIYDTGIMGAYCNDLMCNIENWTELNLNFFVANMNGALNFSGVNFLSSCRDFRVTGPYLLARCVDDSQELVPTYVNINDYVGNYYGYLHVQGAIDLTFGHNWPCMGPDWTPPGFAPGINLPKDPAPSRMVVVDVAAPMAEPPNNASVADAPTSMNDGDNDLGPDSH